MQKYAKFTQKARRPIIAIEPQNGLSNRLRAYISAKALADLTARQLVVVWRKDIHCNASFESLVDSADKIVEYYESHNMITYDYMINKNTIIDTMTIKDIYIKSASALLSDRKNIKLRPYFKNLSPSQAVLDIKKNYEIRNKLINKVHNETISVHIRMTPDQSQDIPGINMTACHWRYFVQPILYVSSNYINPYIIVDTDIESAGNTLLRETEMNGTSLSVQSRCYGKERHQEYCAQHTFANILLLAQSQTLILSESSSYSELVRWFANENANTINGCKPSFEQQYSKTDLSKTNVSIVVACKNRHTHQKVLKNIRNVYKNNTPHIILVDWSSTIPIFAASDITVVHLKQQKKWNLAQAYNLGIQHTNSKYILKIDCDTIMKCIPQIPKDNSFSTGSWKSKNPHTNGILFAARLDLVKVGMYDERFQRYGWEDSDIYQRLSKFVQQKDISPCFEHDDHNDGSRNVIDSFHAEVLTQANRLCSEVQTWNRTMKTSSYRYLYSKQSLIQVWKPESIEKSPYCNYNLAVAIILHKLFKYCKKSYCIDHFWSIINKHKWNSRRKIITELLPTNPDIGIKCLSDWNTSQKQIEQIPTCNQTLHEFDSQII